MARSLQATAAGKIKAERALIDRGWSREDLANQVIVDGTQAITVQTVHKFFAGKAVDRKYFVAICNALSQDWKEINGTSQTIVNTSAHGDGERIDEGCDRSDYRKAIEAAQERIWVYQTWLPGIEIDADQICRSDVPDTRLVLLSFQESSPIYARLKGRKMSVSRAKNNSASSVDAFVRFGKIDCVRFNHGHHPGWITVADSLVFWGPTPVNIDSHSVEFLFHQHSASTKKGCFWIAQFEAIWNEYSHDFHEEINYNEELLTLVN